MTNRQDFQNRMNRATSLMQKGDVVGAGEIYKTLYAQLRMQSYGKRLSRRIFNNVFDGLIPDDVMLLLVNKVAWQLNACRMEDALETIKQYRMIEQDFSLHCSFDFVIDKNEIEAYRRLGNNKRALILCDKLLKKGVNHTQKVAVLILKGTIECDESHHFFCINTLSLALAEAEADGSPVLIAKCYTELAAMVGTHYPALGLSFLWKARVHYEKSKELKNVAFCKSRMAMAYFLLWHRSGQKESRFIEEARRLVNDDLKREDFRHSAAQFSYDRQKGLINNDLTLVEGAMIFFEKIRAYVEFYRSAEFYMKIALTMGDKEAAERGKKKYENMARAMGDRKRLEYILGVDVSVAVACWTPQKEQKEYHNLLDVMEMVAYDEEWFHLEENTFRMMFPTHYQEGLFETLQMPDGTTHLYPCTLYPFRYYRGQSNRLEGKKCQPSLYRGLKEENMFHERLCLKELELLLENYPLTKIYKEGLYYDTPDGTKTMFLNVDTNAIGQHYGIKTDLLDLTADKWVAAFFAATKYKNGEYLPFKDDGIGVIYVYTDSPTRGLPKLSAVGLQPFSRPGCQFGLVYKMQKDEDFNDRARRIFFKHDPAISELIFNYCNRSKKLFPNEMLETKVKDIKASKLYSHQAFANTIKEYYQSCSEEQIQKYIEELHITIQNDAPIVFTESELKTFDERWEKEEEHFFDSVYVRLAYTGPITFEEVKKYI